jgi:hypothetical protein
MREIARVQHGFFPAQERFIRAAMSENLYNVSRITPGFRHPKYGKSEYSPLNCSATSQSVI